MPPRRPVPATAGRPLPSLLSLLAGGTLVEGCAPVECGTARIDEVAAHGPRGAESLSRGDLRQGLQEVAIAVGALPHQTTDLSGIAVGGAPPPVTVAPTAAEGPNPRAPGGRRPTTPAPVETPPEHSEGGVRQVRPHPPRAPVGHQPGAVRGSVRRVGPTTTE